MSQAPVRAAPFVADVQGLPERLDFDLPPTRVAEIRRTQLLAPAGGGGPRVVVISAPPGYGKSTLAAQWCTIDPGRQFVWLALSGSDNDPIALLARLMGRLDRIRPIDPVALERCSARAPHLDDELLGLLTNSIAACGPMVIALDNVERVTSAAATAVVRHLVDTVPGDCQVVLASRRDPAIGLGRLRASGDLLEVRSEQLAMDVATTSQLLDAVGIRLDEQSIVDLQRQTEGWAAGIALAVHSGVEHDGRVVLPQPISGQLREITDYLSEEVLARQSESTRRFLLHTSVLDQFCAELCDYALERSDSSQLLRELERTNLFLVSLDHRRQWYRYHHLFQEMMCGELDRTEPSARRHLLSRAGAWHELDGTVEQAIEYSQASGDLDRVGRLVLQHWQDFAHRGRTESLRMWLLRSSDGEISSDPSLAIGAAWVFLLLGDAERAERFAAAAALHPLDLPSSDGATSLRSALANLRSGLGTGGARQMLEDGLLVCELERPTRTRWLAGGLRAVGTAQLLLGHSEAAIVALREAVVLTENRPQLAYVRVFCLGYLALAHLDCGELDLASAKVQEAAAVVSELGGEDTFQCLPMRAAAATVMVRAHRGGDVGHEISTLFDVLHLAAATPWLLADLSIRCAEVAIDAGEGSLARSLVVRSRESLGRVPDDGLLAQRLDLVQGRLDGTSPPSSVAAVLAALSPAERKVLGELSTHQTLSQIGERLFISRATVKSHVASIYMKLGVHGRGEVIEKIHQRAPDRAP